jgi:RNA-directed DNA polymerase
MTEMVTSGLMRGRWRRSDGPLEGDTRPKRGETAGPRTPCTPPRLRPTLLVVGFQHHAEAVRFQEELRERLRGFGLELHPEKTRLIEFGRFAVQRREERNLGKPATFNFLGFTHISAKSREGKFLLVRQTMRERMRATLRAVKANLRRRQHLPIPTQGRWLGAVVRGYFAYHAVPTNVKALQAFRTQVERHWQRSLRRRGQHDRTNWARMRQLSRRWLPEPKIQHPWPTVRFDVRTRGRSPVR